MKTQLSKPARSKARYTEEYKKEALELWRASGRSAAKVAAELGIRPPLLYHWAQAERVGSVGLGWGQSLLLTLRAAGGNDWQLCRDRCAFNTLGRVIM